jgi:hypothetical protein
MKKEHRRMVRVLRRIFGPRRDKVRGKRDRAENEELHDMYSSPKNYSSDQIKKNEMTGHVVSRGVRRGV